MKSEMNYDVIMMVIPDNIHLLKISCPYLSRNLGADRIIFVANKSCREIINETFLNESGILFLDEETVLQGMTLARIKDILKERCGDPSRAGWFYQQFLKMAYADICANDYYLVFDSDTIPLNPIPYFDKDGKPQFITKVEYHKPYFDTMKVLFNGEVDRVDKAVSYIAENMMINKKIMIEIIDKIMDNENLNGSTFYERILNAIDKKVVYGTGFSEFETYGNYVMTYYPDDYNKIKLRTQRRGSFLFGMDPDSDQLEWAAHDYDIISFEKYGNKWLENKTKSESIRKKYEAKELFDKYIWISHLWDRIRGREVIKYEQ